MNWCFSSTPPLPPPQASAQSKPSAIDWNNEQMTFEEEMMVPFAETAAEQTAPLSLSPAAKPSTLIQLYAMEGGSRA